MKLVYYCLSRLANAFMWCGEKLDDLTIALIKKHNPAEWRALEEACTDVDVEVIDRGNTSTTPRV